jgi:hypothetical protein
MDGMKQLLVTVVIFASWILAQPTPLADVTITLEKAKQLEKDYLLVELTMLKDFPYTTALDKQAVAPNPHLKVPKEILALNGKKVAVRGFMLAFDFKERGVTHFAVSSQDICHYGLSGMPNDWIDVKVTSGKKVRPANFNPVEVFGTLQVGEVVKNGYVESFYRMTADSLTIYESGFLPPGANAGNERAAGRSMASADLR